MQHEKIECLHKMKTLIESTYCHAFTADDKLLKAVENRLNKEIKILDSMYEKIYQR